MILYYLVLWYINLATIIYKIRLLNPAELENPIYSMSFEKIISLAKLKTTRLFYFQSPWRRICTRI